MEYCESSLSSQIKEGKKLDIIKIGIDILEGLSFLHLNGIIHKDIKPANILVKDNVYKIANFGICREVDVSKSTGTEKCTLLYSPPELLNPKGSKASKESDIFSLGVTLVEILNGGSPDRIIGEMKPLYDVIQNKCNHPRLKEYLLKMLESVKENRPSSETLLNIFKNPNKEVNLTSTLPINTRDNLRSADTTKTNNQPSVVQYYYGDVHQGNKTTYNGDKYNGAVSNIKSGDITFLTTGNNQMRRNYPRYINRNYNNDNACFRCGRNSHWVDNCYASSDIYGNPLGDDSSDSSD